MLAAALLAVAASLPLGVWPADIGAAATTVRGIEFYLVEPEDDYSIIAVQPLETPLRKAEPAALDRLATLADKLGADAVLLLGEMPGEVDSERPGRAAAHLRALLGRRLRRLRPGRGVGRQARGSERIAADGARAAGRDPRRRREGLGGAAADVAAPAPGGRGPRRYNHRPWTPPRRRRSSPVSPKTPTALCSPARRTSR